MRWFLSILLFGLLGVVQALSTSGNRLLVVLEELAEKEKYSKYFGDLTSECSYGGIYKGCCHLQLFKYILTALSIRSGLPNYLRITKERQIIIVSSGRENL
jgi:hypothetical protein